MHIRYLSLIGPRVPDPAVPTDRHAALSAACSPARERRLIGLWQQPCVVRDSPHPSPDQNPDCGLTPGARVGGTRTRRCASLACPVPAGPPQLHVEEQRQGTECAMDDLVSVWQLAATTAQSARPDAGRPGRARRRGDQHDREDRSRGAPSVAAHRRAPGCGVGHSGGSSEPAFVAWARGRVPADDWSLVPTPRCSSRRLAAVRATCRWSAPRLSAATHELDAVRTLLGANRLVTLTGTGGTGKIAPRAAPGGRAGGRVSRRRLAGEPCVAPRADPGAPGDRDHARSPRAGWPVDRGHAARLAA